MQSYLNTPQYLRLLRAVTIAAARAAGAARLAAAVAYHLSDEGTRAMFAAEATLQAAFVAAEAALAAYVAQAEACEAQQASFAHLQKAA